MHGESLGVLAAINYFDEDGWRDNSPSKVRQAFVRGDWRGSKGVLTASALIADNNLIGNGLIPDDLYRVRRESVFTSPDQTKNKLQQFALSGAWDATQSLNVTAQIYRRRSDRDGVNGDIYEGFDEFNAERDVTRDNLRKNNPNLPWCQVANLDGSGVPNANNPILNGDPGVTCAYGVYDTPIPRNGGSRGAGNNSGGAGPAPISGNGPGVVQGTPIGLLSKTTLDQVTDGGAAQANWNLQKHRFMVGASSDRSRSGYELRQRLGLIDATHRVYEDPANIDPIYRAAQQDIIGNRFDGTERTNSAYFNETWSPLGNLHLTLAARYNDTSVKSNLLTRSAEGTSRLDQIRNRNIVQPVYVMCTTTNPGSCAATPEPVVFDFNGNAANQTRTQDNFDYESFNPQVGINWLPVPSLNLFANVSRGARVPSVVELGCAFDSTPTPVVIDGQQFGTRPRSLIGPTCNLPTTLSGDPFLPQIRSTSAELGARGRVFESWQWNISTYRTELKDDIYFVGVADGRSYFDTIGKTRRQGVELGFSGSLGPVDIKAGYSFVDATFRSTFYTVSPHNSSADFDQNSTPADNLNPNQSTLPSATANANRGFGTYHMIRIDPGARLPGIPAHNANLSLTWHATQSWDLGLTVIAHSLAYVRGNENNLHEPGGTDQEIGRYVCMTGVCSQAPVRDGRTFNLGGTTPGFAVVNFDTSFAMTKDLKLVAMVNNVLDKDYISGGRLGITPFSPSVNGAIGPSGWNYNSSEWQNTSFLAPGAPRGVFVGLSYIRDSK
jgi:outer membrane receptor protein involved in Fe transport